VSHDARVAVYTIFGTMVAFKLSTALFILWLQPTVHGAAFLTLTNLVWAPLVVVPAALFGVFWYRRLKVRRKRRQLIEAEWNVREPVATARR
jgi:hypothetical protein